MDIPEDLIPDFAMAIRSTDEGIAVEDSLMRSRPWLGRLYRFLRMTLFVTFITDGNEFEKKLIKNMLVMQVMNQCRWISKTTFTNPTRTP